MEPREVAQSLPAVFAGRKDKETLSDCLIGIIHALWLRDYWVTKVAITREVAGTFGFDSGETAWIIGIPHPPQIPLPMKMPMILEVGELPEGVLMEALTDFPDLTYPVRMAD